MFAIIAIGLGLIVAMGGIILFGRPRNNRQYRKTYALSTVVGLTLTAVGLIAW